MTESRAIHRAYPKPRVDRHPDRETATGPYPTERTAKTAWTVQDDTMSGSTAVTATWETQMADEIRRLALEKKQRSTNSQEPYMVALVGIPGSGKTTSAAILTHCLSSCMDDGGESESTFCMPMDGYHYPLETLSAMMRMQHHAHDRISATTTTETTVCNNTNNNNKSRAYDLIYRRGAPDTMDATALERDLSRIRHGNETTVAVPGFDHAKGDPEPNQHVFCRRHHDVVIVEGLYLLLGGDDEGNGHDQSINPNYTSSSSSSSSFSGWTGRIRECFDMSIYLDADIDVCTERLKLRNQCIPGYTHDAIAKRVEAVDRVNAVTVQGTRHWADKVVVPEVSLRPTLDNGA